MKRGIVLLEARSIFAVIAGALFLLLLVAAVEQQAARSSGEDMRTLARLGAGEHARAGDVNVDCQGNALIVGDTRLQYAAHQIVAGPATQNNAVVSRIALGTPFPSAELIIVDAVAHTDISSVALDRCAQEKAQQQIQAAVQTHIRKAKQLAGCRGVYDDMIALLAGYDAADDAQLNELNAQAGESGCALLY